MPPRKSNVSIAGSAAAAATASTPASPTTTTNGPGDTSILSTTTTGVGAEPKSPTAKKGSRQSQQQQDDVGIDDLLLPRSLTSRIARGMLPPNTSLQKDAVLALTKSATVFISYLAATANEQRPSAKTVTPQDVLKALHEMELDKVMGLGERREDGSVGGRLERELAVFEEIVRGKRKGYREKVKARESGVGAEAGERDGGADGERDAKRARRESEADADEEQDEEDALLDAQLNGPNGGLDEHEEEHDDEDEGDDPEDDPDEDQQHDEEEMEDSIDVDDGPGRHGGAGSKGRSSILAPNGRAEVGSDGDDSD